MFVIIPTRWRYGLKIEMIAGNSCGWTLKQDDFRCWNFYGGLQPPKSFFFFGKNSEVKAYTKKFFERKMFLTWFPICLVLYTFLVKWIASSEMQSKFKVLNKFVLDPPEIQRLIRIYGGSGVVGQDSFASLEKKWNFLFRIEFFLKQFYYFYFVKTTKDIEEFLYFQFGYRIDFTRRTSRAKKKLEIERSRQVYRCAKTR